GRQAPDGWTKLGPRGGALGEGPAWRQLTHVDPAAEAGAVDDDDSGSTDVTDHPAFLGELHALGGLDVPDHHSAHHRVLHGDIGLHHPRGLDDQGLGEGQLALDAAADREVLVAGELPVDEDGWTDDRVAARDQILGGHGSAFLHVHVHVALEARPIGDEDPWRLHLTHHAAVGLELDLVGGLDVPGDAAGDLHVLGLDVGLHDARALDEEALAQRDLPLHRALDDEVLVARDLPVDDDAGSDDRVRHVRSVLPVSVPASTGARAGRAFLAPEMH